MQITERVVGLDNILSLSGKVVYEARKDFQQAFKEAKEKIPPKTRAQYGAVEYFASIANKGSG